MLTFQHGAYNFGVIALATASFALIFAGGMAINDYFDYESDITVHPERPIPSNQISPEGALQFSIVVFLAGEAVALVINLLASMIAAFWIIFLILYPVFFKRISGLLSNIVIGLVEGTMPLFGEAAIFQTISITSLSFAGLSLVIVGGNILKDVVSVEGDVKAGYANLAATWGISTVTRVGAFVCFIAIVALTIPYFVGVVSVAYLIPIVLAGLIVSYSGISLFRQPDVQNVERRLKQFYMSIIMYPIALVLGTFLLR